MSTVPTHGPHGPAPCTCTPWGRAAARLVIAGVDPGPTPGVVVLEYASGTLMERHVEQCAGDQLADVLAGYNRGLDGLDLVAAERFVVGRRASRSRTARAGATTRDQVGQLQAMFPKVALRSASEVKPWATDARLEAAGLIAPTKGLRHARDAARHALLAACRDLGMPDPLSATRTHREA